MSPQDFKGNPNLGIKHDSNRFTAKENVSWMQIRLVQEIQLGF